MSWSELLAWFLIGATVTAAMFIGAFIGDGAAKQECIAVINDLRGAIQEPVR